MIFECEECNESGHSGTLVEGKFNDASFIICTDCETIYVLAMLPSSFHYEHNGKECGDRVEAYLSSIEPFDIQDLTQEMIDEMTALLKSSMEKKS